MSSHQYNPIIRATIPMACGKPAFEPIKMIVKGCVNCLPNTLCGVCTLKEEQKRPST